MRYPPAQFLTRQWICSQCRASSASRANYSSAAPKKNLPDIPARTRFAPSPTGYLHLGSLRTALFNYLLAKRTGGQFLLRIEDTDQRRSIPDAEQRLYEDLQWAGLQWNEGPTVGGPFGPYRQSERTSLYRTHANNLITTGHAYRCFCNPDRLDSLARHRNQAGLSVGYDRKCAQISSEESEDRAAKGETYIIRLRADGYPLFNDLVYGKTGQNQQQKGGGKSKLELLDRVYDDPVLVKSDGHPTYHLANVVDDHCMEITHVIRGTEWMPSTPMHVALYNAFNWKPPSFGHVPLLVDQNGQKLSKRNADIDLSSFRDKQCVFPETLVNWAALLGWSHTQKSDVFDLQELEQIFNLKITRGNTTVSFEKLWFLQKAHAQRAAAASTSPRFDDMVTRLSQHVQDTCTTRQLSSLLQSRTIQEYITPLLLADAKAYTTPGEFLARNATFFTTAPLERPPYTPASSSSPSSETEQIPISALHTAAAALSLVPDTHWTIETHRANISSYDGSIATSPLHSSASSPTEPQQDKLRIAADKRFKKELYHYLRWALSSGAQGPGVPETMAILGRAESVRRLEEARGLTSSGSGTEKESRGQGNAWMGSLAPQ